MKTIELTDEEFETLREAFDDVGSDCPNVDWIKFKALGVKFGFWEPELPPTEEELRRRKEFAESPLGKMVSEMLKRVNEHFVEDFKKDWESWNGKQQLEGKIGSQLRIRLPNDYQVKDEKPKD